MTDASLPANRFAAGDFRVGRVLSRTFSVLSRNLLPFCLVTAIASLPGFVIVFLAVSGAFGRNVNPAAYAGWSVLSTGVTMVMNALSQSIVLYGAFQDMRGRRVDLMESTRVGLRRFFPVLGVAIATAIVGGLATLLLIVPGMIVVTMWYVAVPACVVEGLGTLSSMRRSAELTKGKRWKVFGLWFAVVVAGGVIGGILGAAFAVLGRLAGSPVLVLGLRLVWSALVVAFGAILGVVTYHDLRVAKEGVDTDQIAAVFD
jgi:hypothetical protein